MFKKLYTLVFALPLTALCFSCLMSCGESGAGARPARSFVFVGGECLSAPELNYHVPDDEGQQVYDGNLFVFGFTLNLSDTQVERLSKRMFDRDYRIIPSQDLFRSFGGNRKPVEAEYEQVYASLMSSFQNLELVTLAYDGGIRLTASRDFAGHAAGENLAPYLRPVYSEENAVFVKKGASSLLAPSMTAEALSCLGLPMSFGCMPADGISFALPFNGCELVKETTTFELEIPVKVVLYLNWLNDRIGRPDAPVPYREEVLRCRFQTRYSLQ